VSVSVSVLFTTSFSHARLKRASRLGLSHSTLGLTMAALAPAAVSRVASAAACVDAFDDVYLKVRVKEELQRLNQLHTNPLASQSLARMCHSLPPSKLRAVVSLFDRQPSHSRFMRREVMALTQILIERFPSLCAAISPQICRQLMRDASNADESARGRFVELCRTYVNTLIPAVWERLRRGAAPTELLDQQLAQPVVHFFASLLRELRAPDPSAHATAAVACEHVLQSLGPQVRVPISNCDALARLVLSKLCASIHLRPRFSNGRVFGAISAAIFTVSGGPRIAPRSPARPPAARSLAHSYARALTA
jgi:hypothetical protein